MFPQAEIILVNDGSNDKTADILGAYSSSTKVISYPHNMGKGYAIKMGVQAATKDYVVFCDADLPFGIEGITRLLEKLNADPNLDIAIVEKIQPKEKLIYHLSKIIVKKFIAFFTGLKFKDTQAGLKGFKKEVAHNIFAKTFINRFATDIEILYLAKKLHYNVGTLGLRVEDNYYNRPSKFTTKEGFYLLKDIFKIYFHKYNV
ncbi:MAG: glycosyltransferase [Candidatus Parcubacteria bacterium]|nr:glycosyltransferase [Candidatus Parcubacteria bacterium]